MQHRLSIPQLRLKHHRRRHRLLTFFSTTTTGAGNSLIEVKLLHQQLTVKGLTASEKLVARYISCDAPSHALATLTRLPPSPASVFWWNFLIRRAVRLRLLDHALELYDSMHSLGWRPDGYTFPFVLKACGELQSFRRGGSLHANVCIFGHMNNVFVGNALVAMYGRCGDLECARQVFDEMLQSRITDVISWNSIVGAYMQSGDSKKAVRMFRRMTGFGDQKPDAVSLVNILPAFASVDASRRGKEAHAYAFTTELIQDLFVGNAIVDMYAKCGLMDDAHKVFERMPVKDVVSWNAMVTAHAQTGRFEDALGLFEKMREEEIELNVVTWSAVIAGYAQRGHGFEALDVFRQMLVSGSRPNAVTLVSLLSGCACAGALLQGREIHCYAIKQHLNINKNDPGDEQMVINSLIDMYAKCKADDRARKIFDHVAPLDRNVVTWTVMIGGYGDANDALQLFSQMLLVNQNQPTKPNAFTISCALMACARLAALRLGRQIHGYVLRNRYDEVLYVDNCLIDMYVKSGDVDVARVVFNNMNQTNVVSWTCLLTGYGMHGRGSEALDLFNGMRKAGVPIDGVTFVVVLYACSHSGLVNKGLEYFETMRQEFGIVPGVEHYACMVDLLGRAGQLEKAMEMIKEMPMEPSPVVWVALLGSCRVHTNVELGEYASSKLLELGCENDGTYTLLSNIYANAKRWKDVARVRLLMKNAGIKKRPGCSWVQGKTGGTATFYVGDKTHPRSKEIYNLLGDLMYQIKALGYVPDTNFALHDVDDEEKGDFLAEHSEKLALAYGILTTPPGVPIRITKNLRVCGDCHVAITYISNIIQHQIILRDSSRFHHFNNGYCSCKGYW